MKAVIIAAGMGSRLDSQEPKTLLPFGKKTILATILNNIYQAGIKDIIIVLGFKSTKIIEYLEKQNNFGLNISYVKNKEWKKGNGISVLAAKEATNKKNFLLSMSDHLVSVSALKKVISYKGNKNVLLVDPNVDSIFDIDDATKVQVDGNSILNIAKELSEYNGIDCGIFNLNSKFFTSMAEQLKNGNESISAAISGLINKNDMEAVFISEDEYWIDIDTPESYNYAVKNFT
jgi:choline kinase